MGNGANSVALLVIATALLSDAAGDLIKAHCKPDICMPCFMDHTICTTVNRSEVIPQYLDSGLVSLTVTYRSQNGSVTGIGSNDLRRYKSLKVVYLSGDISSIAGDALKLLKNLSSFGIIDTKIQTLPDALLAHNHNVHKLIFKNNLLNEIPLNILPSIGSIYVAIFVYQGNSRTTLPCSNYSMSLPQAFYRFHRLKNLVLGEGIFQNENCPNIMQNFFKPAQNTLRLEVAGGVFPPNIEHALSTFARLNDLDIGNLVPYKFCPRKAESLFNRLPKGLEHLYAEYWETSHDVQDECIVTLDTLQPLLKHKLRKLSFAFSDGMFGTRLFKGILPRLNSLIKLSLASCHLSSIELDAFEGMPNLTYLILDGNPLGSKDLHIFSNPFRSMKDLNLINTDIRSDSSFAYKNPGILCDFPNLETLHFNSNFLKQLPVFASNSTHCLVEAYYSLNSFKADDNFIKQFTANTGSQSNICHVFPNLTNLSLNSNVLHDLSGLEVCINLIHLSLTHNKLSSYGNFHSKTDLTRILSHLWNIEHLDLSFNSIREIDKEFLFEMPKLKTFTFTNNNIEKLHPLQFKRNKMLSTISLGHNYIKVIESDLFKGLKYLVAVDLQDNKLVSLSNDLLKTIRQLPALDDFRLSDNTYYCGCDKTFQNWLHRNPMHKPNLVFMKCSNPPELEGHLVYEYHEDDWECHIKDAVTVAGSVCGGFIFTLAIALPCYKYRWYIKHAKMVWRAFAGSLDLVKLEHICPYDAYVSFNPKSNEDCEWVVQELIPAIEGSNEAEPDQNKKFKLFLEYRDSLSGTNRFTERVLALEKCKRILIVVSNSYLKSTDCLSEADLTGLQMHGTGFYQPNRVMVLIREELSEEILKPPMSSLLLGKTLNVKVDEQRKKQAWKKIRQFLLEPLYVYSKAPDSQTEATRQRTMHREDDFSDTAPIIV